MGLTARIWATKLGGGTDRGEEGEISAHVKAEVIGPFGAAAQKVNEVENDMEKSAQVFLYR